MLPWLPHSICISLQDCWCFLTGHYVTATHNLSLDFFTVSQESTADTAPHLTFPSLSLSPSPCSLRPQTGFEERKPLLENSHRFKDYIHGHGGRMGGF